MIKISYPLIKRSVSAAINAAGQECVLIQRNFSGDEWDKVEGDPTYTDVFAMPYDEEGDDGDEDLVVDETKTVLIRADATLSIVEKDQIAFGLCAADMLDSTPRFEITKANEFLPGDLTVFWKVWVAK